MNRKTTEAKLHRMILKSPLPRIYYYQLQVVTSIRNLTKPFVLSWNTNIQLNPYPNIQLDLYCNSYLFVQCSNSSTWLTPCTNPSTWLTPRQPFDWYSWFITASHRNTNKIFNDGVRDFAWLYNPKAYKKCNKNFFLCRRRLGFQKENLMNLSRVRFFFSTSLFK